MCQSDVNCALIYFGWEHIYPLLRLQTHLSFLKSIKDDIKDDNSHRLVQLYMSIFSLGRLIKLAKPVSKATYKSIVDPPKDLDRIISTVSRIKTVLSSIIPRYLPKLNTIPLKQG